MKHVLFITLLLFVVSFKSNDERTLFKGKHKDVIGRIELVLHNKRTIDIGEPNYVELRGELQKGNNFRLQASGMLVKKIVGDGMYDIRPGRGKGLTLSISIVNSVGEVDTLKTIKVDRFVRNQWPKK